MKFAISIFVLSFVLLAPHQANAASQYTLTTPSVYNIRIFGAEGGDELAANHSVAVADIDGNGIPDLIVGAGRADNNSRTSSGSVYIIYDSLLSGLTETGNSIDLGDSSNYNIRFDGASSGSSYGLGAYALVADDLDGDDKPDLVMGAYNTGYNSRAVSGSLYVVYNTLLDDYSGTGNTVDLSDADNFNIRYDGAAAVDGLTWGGKTLLVDIDNDGKNDIVTGTTSSDFNSRNLSGSVYVIFNTLIDDYEGVGNTVDLNTSTNYNLRFDGATASDRLFMANGPVIGDFDNDNKNDLVMAASGTDYNGRSNSGSMYMIYNTLLDDYTGTGNNIDLATTSNFNIRVDGHVASANLAYYEYGFLHVGDLDNDGKDDIGVKSGYRVFNLFNTLLDDYSGTGNTIDLASSSNYNLSLDVEEDVWDFAGMGGYIDWDFDGLTDVVTSSPWDNGGGGNHIQEGSLYILYGTRFVDFTGTGNSLEIIQSTSENIDVRYDSGQAFDEFTAEGTVLFQDFNGDGRLDALFGSEEGGPGGEGILYIIYNFPHSITQTSIERDGSTVTVKGSITAPNSTTAISGVQYQIDANNPTSGWSSTGCTADDGTFNSLSENFTCGIENAPVTVGTHTVYFRAFNVDTSYTSQNDYLESVYVVSAPTVAPTTSPSSSSSSSSSSSPKEEAPQIPQGQSYEVGGVFVPTKDSYTGGQTTTVIVEPGTFTNDAYFSAQLSVPASANGILTSPLAGLLSTNGGLLPTNTVQASGFLGIKQACGILWQVGGIQQLWYKTYPPKGSDKPPAIIIPELQNKPSIVALGYTPADLVPPGQPNTTFNPLRLTLAHSIDGSMWRILPTSVVDTTNRTVAALHKVGGFYMIVAGCQGGGYASAPVLGTFDRVGADELDDSPQIDLTNKTTQKNNEPITEPQHKQKQVEDIDSKPNFFQRIVSFVKGLF